ncbi:unnamed protein product [Psylliodes chrysocephalus]|uniref:Uncharacterized protein n=1 Tax=Psylliodes chrysocephalus TaxID=3402493 RepID=A0A9P0CWD7_9CUCU|nr:unnamed protein product [Psylliodes chrysocephala]
MNEVPNTVAEENPVHIKIEKIESVTNESILSVPQKLITYNAENKPMFAEYKLVLKVVNVDEEQNDEIEITEEATQIEDNSMSSAPPEIYHHGVKAQWTHNETLALINSVETHYEDMHHSKKRKTFWDVVSNEMISNNFEHECPEPSTDGT